MLTTAWMLGWLVGCTGAEQDALRQAWLVDAMVDDNRVWLSRDPALLEAKLARMAADPYDFMRGTAAVTLRDLSRPGTERGTTAFLTEPATTELLLAGDPHPENIGLFLPGDGPGPIDGIPALLLEINDLDGAHFGPYTWDLRRAATGITLVLWQAGCDVDCRRQAQTAWAEGWLAEVHSDGAWTAAQVPGRLDAVTEELLDDALEGGSAQERLAEFTSPDPDGRTFGTGLQLDEAGRGLMETTDEEQAQIDRLLGRYQGPEGFRVLDVVRRFGQGVASMPAVRYVVAWDRGDPGPDDDELLTVREVVDPGRIPGVLPSAPVTFDSNAQRVVSSHRSLWSTPDADARLAGLTDGATTFKVLTWSAYNVGYDHETLVEGVRSGEWAPADLAAWAAHLGHQLGAMHARAPTGSGADGRAALVADVRGRELAFVEEHVNHAERDLDVLLNDHRLFLDALTEWGPLLGADLLD